MKNTFMIAVSAMALTMAAPAMAENYDSSNNNNDTPRVETTTEAEIEAGWEDTKDAVSSAASNVSEATREAVAETKAWFDTDTDIDAYVETNNRLTSNKLMGKDLVNAEGDKIATLENLVVDGNGAIQGAVLSYGGIVGIGEREVMVDYGMIGSMNADGEYTTSMSKASLDSYAGFEEDNLATGMFLASELADSDIVSPNSDEEIAEVENIVIENGMATKLVVSYFDGIVPEKAMIDFTDADIVVDSDNEASFELSSAEAAQLKAFIKK